MYSLIFKENEGCCEHCFHEYVESVWIHKEKQDGRKVSEGYRKYQKKHTSENRKKIAEYLKANNLKLNNENRFQIYKQLELKDITLEDYMTSLGFIEAEFEEV